MLDRPRRRLEPAAPGSAGGFENVQLRQIRDTYSTPGGAGGFRSEYNDSIGSPGSVSDAAQPDAELAELYKACPLAAVIDLETVANSPEKVDAILPPYHLTADHESGAALEPAIPRIRYPVHLGVASSATRDGDPVRIATSTPAAVDPSRVTASSEQPNPSLQGSGKQGEWLIDPKDWFGTNEKSATEAKSPPQDRPAEPPATTTKEKPLVAPPSPTAPPASPAPPVETPTTSPAPPPMVEATPPATAAPPKTETAPAPVEKKPLFAPPAPAATSPAATTEPLPTPPGAAATPPATSPAAAASASPNAAHPPDVDPHLALFTKNAYPSARECATCHEEIYQQWSISAHAYAAVSPMFNKFEQKIYDLSQGTVGYFCMRCHAPVATSLCLSRDHADLEHARGGPRGHHLRRLPPRAVRVRQIEWRAADRNGRSQRRRSSAASAATASPRQSPKKTSSK